MISKSESSFHNDMALKMPGLSWCYGGDMAFVESMYRNKLIITPFLPPF